MNIKDRERHYKKKMEEYHRAFQAQAEELRKAREALRDLSVGLVPLVISKNEWDSITKQQWAAADALFRIKSVKEPDGFLYV